VQCIVKVASMGGTLYYRFNRLRCKAKEQAQLRVYISALQPLELYTQ